MQFSCNTWSLKWLTMNNQKIDINKFRKSKETIGHRMGGICCRDLRSISLCSTDPTPHPPPLLYSAVSFIWLELAWFTRFGTLQHQRNSMILDT